MATAKYLIGKLLTRAAGEEELVAELGDEYEYMEADAPVTIATIVQSYGPDKFPEVQEALDIAKTRRLGDIAQKLADWIVADSQDKARSIQGMAEATLGPRSTPDTEGVVAENITGIKGPVSKQLEVLKQRIVDAKKAAAEARLVEGGRRRTRKRKVARRKTRTAKKSRRKYK